MNGRIGLAAVLLVACSGPEQQFSDLYPVFSFAPDALDVGPVGPPLVGEGTLTVTNAGSKVMTFTADLADNPEGVFTLDGGPVDAELAPDDTMDLHVLFAPLTYKAYEAKLAFETSDPERPKVQVDVTGVGVDLPFPDIGFDPGQTVEVEEVPPGESGLFVVYVTNTGDADLVVDAVTLDGGAEFVPRSIDPFTVPPNDRGTLLVSYEPNGADGSTATLSLHSNDPDEADTQVLLIGNGGGEFEFPVAVIDCPSTVELAGPQNVHLSGAGSSDPAGLVPLSYQWAVTQRPPASDAGIPLDPDDTQDVDLRVDVAGDWQVQMYVQNAIGTPSAPAVCAFSAVPADDLHVELSWDGPSADVDLHLNQAGNLLFDEPGDCNWCNKNADWGASGTDDDPRLDIDDQGGLGPENVNILHPADGGYEVRVHYFDGHGDGAVTATVKVWLAGVEVFSGSQVISPDDVWNVGQIDWSATPAFLVDTGPVAHIGARRACF